MSSGSQTQRAKTPAETPAPTPTPSPPAGGSEPQSIAAVVDRLVKPAAPRPQGDSAERLSRSFETLIRKAGYQTADERRREEAREERLKAEQWAGRTREFHRTCGVFPRYANAALDDVWYPGQVLGEEDLQRYLKVRDDLASLLAAPGILVLSGENGPGKTHLASALVHRFCDAGRAARYCRAIDFYRALKSTFGEPGRTAEELVRRYEGYELLVIDEIEVRSDSAWENNEMRSLLDARYGRLVSTVLCTNKSKAELNGEDGNTPYLSRALRDRIRHEGGILECKWRSLRGAEVAKP